MNLEFSFLNNVIVNEYIEREKVRERESERERVYVLWKSVY